MALVVYTATLCKKCVVIYIKAFYEPIFILRYKLNLTLGTCVFIKFSFPYLLIKKNKSILFLKKKQFPHIKPETKEAYF